MIEWNLARIAFLTCQIHRTWVLLGKTSWMAEYRAFSLLVMKVFCGFQRLASCSSAQRYCNWSSASINQKEKREQCVEAGLFYNMIPRNPVCICLICTVNTKAVPKSVGLVGWLRGEQRILIELFHWSQSWNNKTIHKYIESESNWWLLISLQVQSSKPSSLGL